MQSIYLHFFLFGSCNKQNDNSIKTPWNPGWDRDGCKGLFSFFPPLNSAPLSPFHHSLLTPTPLLLYQGTRMPWLLPPCFDPSSQSQIAVWSVCREEIRTGVRRSESALPRRSVKSTRSEAEVRRKWDDRSQVEEHKTSRWEAAGDGSVWRRWSGPSPPTPSL